MDLTEHSLGSSTTPNNEIKSETVDADVDVDADTFDENETYCPVFCVARVPDEYFDKLTQYARHYRVPWAEIATSDPEQFLVYLRTPETAQSSTANSFTDWDTAQVYDFYKDYVRPDQLTYGWGEHFTAFSFIIVDRQCVQKEQVLLCCDAPDFDEQDDEIRLKVMRVSIGQGLAALNSLEDLTVTPSEFLEPSVRPLELAQLPHIQRMPDRWLGETAGKTYRIATACEARANKRRAIIDFRSTRPSP